MRVVRLSKPTHGNKRRLRPVRYTDAGVLETTTSTKRTTSWIEKDANPSRVKDRSRLLDKMSNCHCRTDTTEQASKSKCFVLHRRAERFHRGTQRSQRKGQDDIFFTREGGEAYLADLPKTEMHRLTAGHFAVEDCLNYISEQIHRFLRRICAQLNRAVKIRANRLTRVGLNCLRF